jgi:hypothetical protein
MHGFMEKVMLRQATSPKDLCRGRVPAVVQSDRLSELHVHVQSMIWINLNRLWIIPGNVRFDLDKATHTHSSAQQSEKIDNYELSIEKVVEMGCREVMTKNSLSQSL